MDDTKAISYCALYCGNCFIRLGKIADLSKQLLQELEIVEFSKWAKELATLAPEMKPFENYQNCLDVLKAWDNDMRCTRFCQDGGGSSSCKIRLCCMDKKLAGCWECDQYETCDTLAWLKPVNGRQNVENIKEIISNGHDAFVSRMKNKRYSDFFKQQ